MALRLIELVLPEADRGRVSKALRAYPIVDTWTAASHGDKTLVRILLTEETTQAVLDRLEAQFSGLPGFRIVLFPVEASLPRPPEPEETAPPEGRRETEGARAAGTTGISREELYVDVADTTKLSPVYLAMVALSSIVAAIGIVRNDVAVVIRAMVLAPLLGPNVALALATTLGDAGLARRALQTLAAGLLTALALSVALGFGIPVDPDAPAITARTRVGPTDFGLALAAGAAGALAFTTGVPAALVGVMVAVALLPPLVTCGLLASAGQGPRAIAAMWLAPSNIICVNLAGVTTFLVQGIHPLSWWEADRARRATRLAIALWTALLVGLVVVTVIAKRK